MTVINQVGIIKTEPCNAYRRSERGYMIHNRELSEYAIYLSDHTQIGTIATGDETYLAYDEYDARRIPLGSYPTITSALRAVFGKPDYGYSWYEIAS